MVVLCTSVSSEPRDVETGAIYSHIKKQLKKHVYIVIYFNILEVSTIMVCCLTILKHRTIIIFLYSNRRKQVITIYRCYNVIPILIKC